MRTDDLDAPDLLLSWRLLAANNRDVARSAAPYPDLNACLDAVAKLQSNIDDAVAVAARSGRADWSWRLRLDGRDVAVSSRTYQRRLQCEAACALFVSLVRDATLDVFGHGEALEPVASPDECGTEAPAATANAESGELEPVAPTQPAPADPVPVEPAAGRLAPALPAGAVPVGESSRAVSPSTGSPGPTPATWSASEIMPPRP